MFGKRGRGLWELLTPSHETATHRVRLCRPWFPCFHSLPKERQWEEPCCYRKLRLCAKQCHLIEGWMSLDEPPPYTWAATRSNEHFSGLLWLAQSLWCLDSRLWHRGAQENTVITRNQGLQAKGRWKVYFLPGNLSIILLVICHLLSFFCLSELTFGTLKKLLFWGYFKCKNFNVSEK